VHAITQQELDHSVWFIVRPTGKVLFTKHRVLLHSCLAQYGETHESEGSPM